MNYINNIKKINYISINQYVIYHLIIIINNNKKGKNMFFLRFYYRNILHYK